MYESEINDHLESIDTLPRGTIKRFEELTSLVEFRTALPWGEHCTECAWPTCYTTCELYDRREDGGCRLFIDGMTRIDIDEVVRPYLLKLRFKRWAKLWTVGNLARYSRQESLRKEKRNMMIGALARSTPLPRQLKSKVLGKVAYLRRCEAERASPADVPPDCFLIECYNPSDRPFNLTLSIRARHEMPARAFQRVVQAVPGFHIEHIAVGDILQRVDLLQPFEVEIVPNEADDTVLYFGFMDFAWLYPEQKVKMPSNGSPKPWKCIVWDLDNTLWDGTLIEDGEDRLQLRHNLVEVIKETDRRGILHSIASKNNHDDAIHVLQKLKIDQYFLYPQISWDPKSQSIAKVAQLLNIGVESFAFVDDQPFEREEVRNALPQVAIVDAADAGNILSRSECQVPITEESQQRRTLYQQEKERKHVQELFEGDYSRFLQECKITVSITRLTEENLERVYELAQRTNQMNFSGSRYPREQLAEIQQSQDHETFVIRCADRFGSYGIVGFALVDIREPRLMDLMFSCRIQGKRVEHAFLGYLIEKYSLPERRDFCANYRKTTKNEKPGKMFEEIGFECIAERDGLLSLKYPKTRLISKENIISIHEAEKEVGE